MRSAETEGTDGTRCEHCTSVLSGNFENIPQTVNTDFPCQLRLGLGNNGKESRKIVNRVNAVLLHCGGNHLAISNVHDFRRT